MIPIRVKPAERIKNIVFKPPVFIKRRVLCCKRPRHKAEIGQRLRQVLGNIPRSVFTPELLTVRIPDHIFPADSSRSGELFNDFFIIRIIFYIEMTASGCHGHTARPAGADFFVLRAQALIFNADFAAGGVAVRGTGGNDGASGCKQPDSACSSRFFNFSVRFHRCTAGIG